VNDKDILQHIDALVQEEHALDRQGGEQAGLGAEQLQRLQAIKVQLDQFWDLLDQRRARRDAGQSPNLAHMRDAKTVENYQQ